MTTSESKIIKTIEADEGTTKIYESGLLESFINEGAYIDVPYLLEGKKLLDELGSDRKFYVLSESSGFYRISKEARELSASKEYSAHIAAVAVITKHISIKLVFDLYLKIDKPAVPTKAFTDREAGLKWLDERMSK
ncbi:MAG: hypothetical protein K0S32_3847 [Bacteroidetes bacterium]|jgi:hypothetical protein|nr:hypothetical protein [Bacteroidota bacterium]